MFMLKEWTFPDWKSNKMLDTSGQYYGGKDGQSHQISGQDPVQDIDFDGDDQEIAHVVNAEKGGRQQ